MVTCIALSLPRNALLKIHLQHCLPACTALVILAAKMPDGNIEFQGRTDQQVKINGFRIELGEVERTLELHPGIEHCVVASLGDQGRKRLIAYLVAKENGQANGVTYHSVRSFLGNRLPEFMVPTQYVSLDSLPLSSNGKIDRSTAARARHEQHLQRHFRGQIPYQQAGTGHRQNVAAWFWSRQSGSE